MQTDRRTMLKITAAGSVGVAMPALAQARDKVRLRLDWVFGSEHAPIFLAMERGYFRDVGIDVDVMPGDGSSVTVKLVGNRDTDFGYATADQVVIGAQRGLDLIATAVTLQQNPTGLIFRTSEAIKDPKQDLVGKTIGVQLKSNTSRQWEAFKKIMQIDASTLREVPADGALVPMIATKRIDVGVGFYFNDAIKLKATGEDVSWLLFEDYGLKMYSTSLLTHPALVKDKPDLVKRFTQAFMKGWQAAVREPQAAYQAFIAANPGTDKLYAELKLPEVLKLAQSDDVKANGLGHSTLAAWEELQNQLVSMDMLKGKTDVSKIFTNDYLG